MLPTLYYPEVRYRRIGRTQNGQFFEMTTIDLGLGKWGHYCSTVWGCDPFGGCGCGGVKALMNVSRL